MLVITRRYGESFTIGDNIRITVDKGQGRQIQCRIEAPRQMAIVRDELIKDRMERDNATTQLPD
jgi:carbon storage regulator